MRPSSWRLQKLAECPEVMAWETKALVAKAASATSDERVVVRLEHCKAKHQGPRGPTSAVRKPRPGRVCVCVCERDAGGEREYGHKQL